MKKRSLLAVFLILSVCFASLHGCSGSEHPDAESSTAPTTAKGTPIANGTYQNYKYDEYEDHVILTACLKSENVVWLPQSIHNKPVTGFGTIFAKNFKLSTVNIPASVISIDERAFYMCDHLVTVNISNGLKSIGKQAFSGCASLSTAKIPPSVTSIAADAFEYCLSLIICGEKGSAVEEYANRFQSINFSPISFSTDTPVTEETSAEESSATETTTAAEQTTAAPSTAAEETSVPETTAPLVIDEF